MKKRAQNIILVPLISYSVIGLKKRNIHTSSSMNHQLNHLIYFAAEVNMVTLIGRVHWFGYFFFLYHIHLYVEVVEVSLVVIS